MANLLDTRFSVSEELIRNITESLVQGLLQKMTEKGPGSFVHRHEIMGCIQEEYHELIEASHSRKPMALYSELEDLAMAAIFSIASLRFIDPSRR